MDDIIEMYEDLPAEVELDFDSADGYHNRATCDCCAAVDHE